MEKCLGFKIRKIRELKNISQFYLAKQLGISQSAYSDIEGGKTKIDKDKLVKIAQALDVNSNVIENFDTEVALKACAKTSNHNAS